MLQYNELSEVSRGLGINVEKTLIGFLQIEKKSMCIKVYCTIETVSLWWIVYNIMGCTFILLFKNMKIIKDLSLFNYKS